jgi:hypothetical protein
MDKCYTPFTNFKFAKKNLVSLMQTPCTLRVRLATALITYLPATSIIPVRCKYTGTNTSDTSPLTATGGLVCQLSGLNYIGHQYEREVLEESYHARYKAHRGATLPPASVIPAPSVVEVRWEAHCGNEYTLQVIWFLPKSKTNAALSSSAYTYTLRCHSLD